MIMFVVVFFFFFQAEDGIRDIGVTGVQTCALPIVPELVEDGECGLLVPPRDAKALAYAMRHVLESPEARKSMGEASARRAEERFDLRVMTEAYEDLNRKPIARNRSQWEKSLAV